MINKKTDLKLTIELIPKNSWGNNLRSGLTKKNWNHLRIECYEGAKNTCEICGDVKNTKKLECHEVWEFDDEKKVQTLEGLIALCPPCHQVKHIGLSSKMGRGQQAIEHLAEVNNWKIEEASNYVEESFEQWNERSRYLWKLNLDWLKRKGVTIEKIKKESPKEIVALLEAIKNNDAFEVRQFLSKANKFNTATDKSGNHVLHHVVTCKNIELIKLFLNDKNFSDFVDRGNNKLVTPLMLACQLGQKDIVKILVRAGANTSKKCKYKKTIIHYAALSNNFEIFKYVYSSYGKGLVNECDFKEGLFFHRIMSSEQFFTSSLPSLIKLERSKILEFSLSFLMKDQIIKKDKFGKTFLHCAAYLGDRKLILKTLEKGGVDVINSFDKYGKTPINEAALGLNIEAIKILLDKNAQFKHKTKSGETAFEIVERNMGTKIAEEVFGPYMNRD